MPFTDKTKAAEYSKQYHATHKDYYRRKSAEWARATRDKNGKYLRDYKIKKGCADCGFNQNAVALQFDHARGRKRASPWNLASTTSYMTRELRKCDVVCANCHAIRTEKRRLDGIVIAKHPKFRRV